MNIDHRYSICVSRLSIVVNRFALIESRYTLYVKRFVVCNTLFYIIYSISYLCGQRMPCQDDPYIRVLVMMIFLHLTTHCTIRPVIE